MFEIMFVYLEQMIMKTNEIGKIAKNTFGIGGLLVLE